MTHKPRRIHSSWHTTGNWPDFALARHVRTLKLAVNPRNGQPLIEQLPDGASKNSSHPNPSPLLMVEDADTLEAFEANARAIWYRWHDPTGSAVLDQSEKDAYSNFCGSELMAI